MRISITRISAILPDQKEIMTVNNKEIEVNKVQPRNISQYSTQKGLKRLPLSTQNAIIAAIECTQGIDFSKLSSRIGVFVGCAMSYIENTKNFMGDTYNTSAKYVSPLAFPNTVLNSVSGWISIVLGVTGLNMTINTGATSSIDALKIGTDYLKFGTIDKAIVVGVEEITQSVIKYDESTKQVYTEGAIAVLLEKDASGSICDIKEIRTILSKDKSNRLNRFLSKYYDDSERVCYKNDVDLNYKQQCFSHLRFGESFALNGFLKVYDFLLNDMFKKGLIVEENVHGNKCFVAIEKNSKKLTDTHKKIAIVTGGTKGIGRAIAIDLINEGYKVYATYHRDEAAANKLKEEISDFIPFMVDASDYDKAREFVDYVAQAEGQIDVLINNAGMTKDKSIGFMNKKSWDEVLNTNLNSVFSYTRFVCKVMMQQGYGNIVNMSSVSANYAIEGQSNYSASKGAIISFTRVVAKEMAKHNIRVNAVSPGFVETDMVVGLDQTKLIDSIKMGRLADPHEVSSVVLFLISENASYITGQNIIVDGGLSL